VGDVTARVRAASIASWADTRQRSSVGRAGQRAGRKIDRAKFGRAKFDRANGLGAAGDRISSVVAAGSGWAVIVVIDDADKPWGNAVPTVVIVAATAAVPGGKSGRA
jgi:hypothetical protein